MNRLITGIRYFSKVNNETLLNQIKSEIAANHTVIYSKTYCPYCTRAKGKLLELKLEPLIKELDEDPIGPHIQSALHTLTNQRSVPSIFIKGQHIGGCDDLFKKCFDGSINKLLESL